MNDIPTKPKNFLKRFFRTNILGQAVRLDREHAISRQMDIITHDDDGQTHIIAVQYNHCDCRRVLHAENNPLLGVCGCGTLVCKACAVTCCECNALSCPSCSAGALFTDEFFCGRCRGGIPLIKRILIGKEPKK